MKHHNLSARTPYRDARLMACHGKHRFDSAALAKEVASRSNRRASNHMSAYHCAFCQGWHIGGWKRHVKNKKDR